MELRDYFAAQALQGMLAHAKRYKPRKNAPDNWHNAISIEAYEIADAMLAKREHSLNKPCPTCNDKGQISECRDWPDCECMNLPTNSDCPTHLVPCPDCEPASTPNPEPHKQFHCPDWPNCACPDGTTRPDCPGLTMENE